MARRSRLLGPKVSKGTLPLFQLKIEVGCVDFKAGCVNLQACRTGVAHQWQGVVNELR
jgi:hypothetical protein